MATNQQDPSKPRVRPPEVAAGYLVVRVRKMQAEEEGVVQAARLAHRAKIAKIVAKQPPDVQKAFYRLSHEPPAPSSTETDG